MSQNDNDLARLIDPDAADKMEAAGYDIKFLGPLKPAFRNRENGVWSYHTANESCLLGESWEEISALAAEVQSAEKAGWGAVMDFMIIKGWPRRAEILETKEMATQRDAELMARFQPNSSTARMIDRGTPLAGQHYRIVRFLETGDPYAFCDGHDGLLLVSFQVAGRWYHKVEIGMRHSVEVETHEIMVLKPQPDQPDWADAYYRPR